MRKIIQNYTNSFKFNSLRNYPVNEHPNISENLFYAITQIISVSHYEIRSFTMYHWNTRVFGRIRGLIRIYIYMYTRIKKSFVYVHRKKGGDRWFHCARCIDSLHDYHSRGMINRVAKARLAANCVKYTIDRN